MKWENLLFNLVQIGLTVSAAALLPLILRRVLKKRYPARAMCLVWALLAVRLLVPVQLTLPEPPVQVTPRTNYVVLRQNDPVSQVVQPETGAAPKAGWVTASEFIELRESGQTPALALTLGGVLALCWLCGGALFAAEQVLAYRRFRRKLNSGAHPVESQALRAIFDGQKRALGVRRDIPLLVSPAADCPMLAGFLKPALYLPDESLSAQDAAFIFRHELTHHKHGDLWLKLLLVLARAVQWFNPLIHLMARFAQEDIELACDDAVAKDMDGAARRAYGETILRSAAAQAKKRALVSCFTGDKETLMRRFEGLFDKNVKKRGVALVLAVAVLVGTLGCAFSVGGSKAALTRDEMLRLASAAAEAKLTGGFTRYTVVPEQDTALLVFAQDGRDGEDALETRVAERLYFENAADGWRAAKSEIVADKADSLAHFRMLYENDLGLPEQGLLSYLEGGKAETVREWDATGDGENDMTETRYTFADGSVLTLTNGQDWTDENGENNRTAADLAQQYARAVYYKSVWPLYPVLSGDGQQALADHQRSIAGSEPDGVWYTKFGGSSPSFRNYVIVPTGEPDSAIVVFQEYGGGTSDVRSANKVVIGKENGRSVITGFEEYDMHMSWMLTEMKPRKAELTKRELFLMYYTTGLPWPDLYYGNTGERLETSFNGAPLTALLQPVSAAETVFNYFGEQVEHVEGTYHEMRTESWLAGVELLSQSGAEAVVRLSFTDGSTPLNVQMRKDSGYWLPCGIAAQYDSDIAVSAYPDGARTGTPLPTGETVEAAVAAANGDIPVLSEGARIKIEAAGGKTEALDLALSDRILRADGTPQYDDRVTHTATLRSVMEKDSTAAYYTVEKNPAEVLASTLTRYTYRGVTLAYEWNGTPYTAAFVFRTENPDVPEDVEATAAVRTIDSAAYTNPVYGYTLTLSDSFVGDGYIDERDPANVIFGLRFASGNDPESEFRGGTVMNIAMDLTALFKRNFGENWTAGFPVPCVELAQRDGLVWYAALASDVQYDPADTAKAAAYQKLYAAASALGGNALSFGGQTEVQRRDCAALRLQKQGEAYAYSRSGTGDGPYLNACEVTPSADNACTVRVEWSNLKGDYFFHTVERVRFDDANALTPSHAETLLDTSDGVRSLADFQTAFGGSSGARLPVWTLEGLEALGAIAAAPASTETPDLKTPEACAAYTLHLTGGTWSAAAAPGAQDEECRLRYEWRDGAVSLHMQRVRLAGDSPVLWLPFGWQTDDGQGAVPQYPPYIEVLARAISYYPDRTTGELFSYLDYGFADGAYAEGIFAELDKRWQADPDAVTRAAASFGGLTQAAWEEHLHNRNK
ncbi:MAG: M56 family metallopeptidase [Eubacteriales bacterium]|nr:M56 family metallopeptidase [Eubacteriales bacterium]